MSVEDARAYGRISYCTSWIERTPKSDWPPGLLAWMPWAMKRVKEPNTLPLLPWPDQPLIRKPTQPMMLNCAFEPLRVIGGKADSPADIAA